MRLAINLQRAIARMHLQDPGHSDRSIAKELTLSHATVGRVRQLVVKSCLSLPLLDSLADSALQDLLGSHDRSHTRPRPLPEWPSLCEERLRRRCSLKTIWREWKDRNPEATGYTQFTLGYRSWCQSAAEQASSGGTTKSGEADRRSAS